MLDARLTCLLILLMAGAFVVLLRYRSGSWSNPSVVFGIFWSLMTLLPILFVPEIAPSPEATLYIAAAIAAFGIPALFFHWQPALIACRVRLGAHRRMLLLKHVPIAQGYYIFFAGYLYTSYIISLTIWSSVFFSTALTIIFLAFIAFAEGRNSLLMKRDGDQESDGTQEPGREARV